MTDYNPSGACEGTIVFVMPLSDAHQRAIKEIAPNWRLVCGKDPSSWQEALQEAEIVGGWHSSIAESCVQPDSRLRWVQNWGAGVDRLPLSLLKSRGVWLTNASGVHAIPISETIFAMLLAFTRKLHVYVRNQSTKRWHHANLGGELHGKALGVVGIGAIGRETARIAKAFGMRVLAVNRSGSACPEADQMCSLPHALAESDYVVNTLPLTPETRHLFNAEAFSSMKPSAYYINIGRGETTDTEALVRALRSGVIAGAGLDVFEQEPLPADHPLWEMEQVIITPHSSGSTEHYNERAMDIFLENLRDYLAGNPPCRSVVDLDLGY